MKKYYTVRIISMGDLDHLREFENARKTAKKNKIKNWI